MVEAESVTAVGGEWEWLLTLMFFLQLHRHSTTVCKDILYICFAIFLEPLVVTKGECCFNGRGADIQARKINYPQRTRLVRDFSKTINFIRQRSNVYRALRGKIF